MSTDKPMKNTNELLALVAPPHRANITPTMEVTMAAVHDIDYDRHCQEGVAVKILTLPRQQQEEILEAIEWLVFSADNPDHESFLPCGHGSHIVSIYESMVQEIGFGPSARDMASNAWHTAAQLLSLPFYEQDAALLAAKKHNPNEYSKTMTALKLMSRWGYRDGIIDQIVSDFS